MTLVDNREICQSQVSISSKNARSRLQPLYAELIEDFKSKAYKLFMRYFVSQMDNNKQASNIFREMNLLKVFVWVTVDWKELSSGNIKHCRYCDQQSQTLFSEISANYSVDEYVDAYNNLANTKKLTLIKLTRMNNKTYTTSFVQTKTKKNYHYQGDIILYWKSTYLQRTERWWLY